MVKFDHAFDHENLGTFLKKTRTDLGIDLDEIANDTKISLKNLTAMENSDFSSLPAEAFTRGFYTLYAKVLDLSPTEILARYTRERELNPPQKNVTSHPPADSSQAVGNMAERPSIMPLSYIGLILLILLIVGALVCWYFSWNPATYLSEQLRSLEDPAVAANDLRHKHIPVVTKHETAEELETFFSNHTSELFSVTSSATAAAMPPAFFYPPPPPPPPRYTVNAYFNDKTRIKLTIDDLDQQVLDFGPGENATWQSENKMRIIAIGKHKPQLILNASPIELPKTTSKTISVIIPDSLLQ